MSDSRLVRASRDGDQFHYAWAARRCLKMLLPQSSLVAVSVEGASGNESDDASQIIEAGEEIIDIGEYYGSDELKDCLRVEYVQLKHSTLRTDAPWTLSELAKTLNGFAKRFSGLRDQHGLDLVKQKAIFRIVTNRPFGEGFKRVIAAGSTSAKGDNHERRALLKATKLKRADLAHFCELLILDRAQDDYIGQRQSLRAELRGYLVGDDEDASGNLKNLVSDKALTINEASNVIRQVDVLRALHVSPDDLLPAPNLIENGNSLGREQELEIAEDVVQFDGPTVIEASGGIGKSVLAARLPRLFPPGSVTVVYDCFGNGAYRQAASPRHLPRQGLVQIANELAAQGLCDPLIPSDRADRGQYFKAFLHRLNQADESIRFRHPGAFVCVIVDAADNAEMFAEECRDGESFIRTLLREKLPANVRLIALSRPERVNLLSLPSTIIPKKLREFSPDESRRHLQSRFPDATEADAVEFHRLTSANPRIQASILDQEPTVSSVLASLGVSPLTVEAAIARLLERAVAKLMDNSGPIEHRRVEVLCRAIAILRPFVPINVVAGVAGIDPGFVRSFTADIGRPLLISGEAIQFRDEPTETWFRERFRPDAKQLVEFAQRLEPIAAASAYAASALPQILLESGQFDRLIDLALSGGALPTDSPTERRDIEVQRLLFALRAALRDQQHLAAAKLALKAGQEVSGVTRQESLFQKNLDLLAAFLPPDRIREMVARHSFASEWLGSRHVYEAALLSSVRDFAGEARSQLRMAELWLRSWVEASEEDRDRGKISVPDLAEMASAYWRLDGPEACVRRLETWGPESVLLRIGVILARRSLDSGAVAEVQTLLNAASDNFYLALGINLELRRSNFVPEQPVVERLIAHLAQGNSESKDADSIDGDEPKDAIVALVESAVLHGLSTAEFLAALLDSVLTGVAPHHLLNHNKEKRFTILRAFTLRARLRGQQVTLADVAPPKIKERLEKNQPFADERQTREFREAVGSLLPWHTLCVEQLFSPFAEGELAGKLHLAIAESANARDSYFHEYDRVSEDVALLWGEVLCGTQVRNDLLIKEFLDWVNRDGNCSMIPTWTSLARRSARSQTMTTEAYEFSMGGRRIIEVSALDAESRAECYIGLARALLSRDMAEAKSLFDRAVDVASKLGDEIVPRWAAILDLSNAAAGSQGAGPEIGYRVARCAELVHEYESNHFEWEDTIQAINGLSPSGGLAILSRWHDRRFGWTGKTLKIGIEDLLDRGYLPPRATVPMFAFRASWDHVTMLDRCLTQVTQKVDRKQTLDRAVRILALDRHSVTTWQKLKDIAQRFGIDCAMIDDRIEFEAQDEFGKQSKSAVADESKSMAPTSDLEDSVWRELGCDNHLYTADELTSVFRSWRKVGQGRKRGLSTDSFIRRMIAGAAAEKVVAFIQAFAESDCFGIMDVNKFYAQIPREWTTRLSVRKALKDAARAAAARFCADISNSKYYEPLSLSRLAQVVGMDKRELVAVALRALGDSPDLEYPSRLFSVVGLLAGEMCRDEAYTALDFGLSLIEAELSPSTGDGTWREDLLPPVAPNESLAGFVYAKLASPIAKLRWEAAHVVHELCIAGEDEVITNLVTLCRKRSAGAFVDQQLRFYDLHAREWLLIALARASKDHPGILRSHIGFFIENSRTEDHVVIRHFASQAALSLAKHGIPISDDELERLIKVNSSPFPLIESERIGRMAENTDEPDEDETDDHFSFGYDMDEDWFRPLARCFAMNGKSVMAMANDIVRNVWGSPHTGYWSDDQRGQRKIFREGETRRSKSSYPETDDLSFYLSYHALMTAAGRLLGTIAVHIEPKDSKSAFEKWLEDHLLTRPDGRWLADRRDPEPVGLLPWINQERSDNWRWQIARSDFDRYLGLNSDRLSLWANWLTVDEPREEEVWISSALVTTERSEALLRAMQSAEDTHNIPLPTADGDYELDQAGFQLAGWVCSSVRYAALDGQDPWAGSIEFSGPMPSETVKREFQLFASEDDRSWTIGAKPGERAVLWSEVWGENRGRNNGDSAPRSGSRLQVARPFLSEFLQKNGMAMIAKVTINRRMRKARYDSDRGERHVLVPRSFRIFLFKPDGTESTV